MLSARRSLKRPFLFALPVVLVIAGYWFINWEPDAPRFRAIAGPFHAPPATGLYYSPFNLRIPPDSAIWLTLVRATNQTRILRFDLQQERVTGELVGATPLFSDASGRNLACLQRSPRISLRDKLKLLIERVTAGKLRLAKPAGEAVETLWVIRLDRGTAKRVGQRMMPAGFSVVFTPSPSGRYAFSTSAMAQTNLTYLCDILANRWWTEPAIDWPVGWWDETHLVLRAVGGFDFLTMNIENGEKRTLLSREGIDSFFRQHGIPVYKSQPPTMHSYWNGHESEFYFFNGDQSVGEPSHFVRLRRPEAALELVRANLEFERFGQFDTSGTRYAYATRVAGDCCNGVSVRDVLAKTERAVVPATSTLGSSVPFFYGDSICYARTNELWRINVNGSNNTRLFPPKQ
jgi:hypothetical protein